MRNWIKYLLLLLFIVYSRPSFDQLNENNYSLNTNLVVSLNQTLTNSLSDYGNYEVIDKEINHFMDKNELKGVSVSIIHNEKLIFSKGYGYANQEDSVIAKPGNIYRVASVSKLLTAVAIMKLVEQKKLKLTTKVFGPRGIINEKKYEIVDPRLCDITVLDLLNHSGGWTQNYGDPMFNPTIIAKLVGDSLPATVDTYTKFVFSRRLHFTPGTMHSYSNMGYMFLGEVIRKVSGMPYEDYVRKQILSPMGIYDMHLAQNLYEYRYPNEVKYYVYTGDSLIHSFSDDSTLVPKVYGGNDIRLLGAAGGWVASAPELAKLLVSIDGNNTIEDFLSHKSIEDMTGRQGRFLGWKQEYQNGWLRMGISM